MPGSRRSLLSTKGSSPSHGGGGNGGDDDDYDVGTDEGASSNTVIPRKN